MQNNACSLWFTLPYLFLSKNHKLRGLRFILFTRYLLCFTISSQTLDHLLRIGSQLYLRIRGFCFGNTLKPQYIEIHKIGILKNILLLHYWRLNIFIMLLVLMSQISVLKYKQNETFNVIKLIYLYYFKVREIPNVTYH